MFVRFLSSWKADSRGYLGKWSRRARFLLVCSGAGDGGPEGGKDALDWVGGGGEKMEGEGYLPKIGGSVQVTVAVGKVENMLQMWPLPRRTLRVTTGARSGLRDLLQCWCRRFGMVRRG